MRYAFIALIVFACGIVRGEDAAAIPSVVNHGQQAPAPKIESPAVISENCACESDTCATARCRRLGRVRFRTVTEGCDVCTGQSVRSVTRGVVRGTGAVVRGTGEAVVNVITLPARVCRGGRCSCN